MKIQYQTIKELIEEFESLPIENLIVFKQEKNEQELKNNTNYIIIEELFDSVRSANNTAYSYMNNLQINVYTKKFETRNKLLRAIKNKFNFITQYVKGSEQDYYTLQFDLQLQICELNG